MPGRNGSKYDAIAMAFHAYVCAKQGLREQVADRDSAHVAFVEFYKSYNDNNGGGGDINHTKSPQSSEDQHEEREEKVKGKKEPALVFVEATVMTRLRQFRLLKSRRYNDKVVMIFADTELQTDKHGIAIVPEEEQQQQIEPSDTPQTTTTTTVEIGEIATYKFSVVLTPDYQQDSEIEMTSVTIKGQHSQRYKLQLPFSLPRSINEESGTTFFQISVTAKSIGLLRCTVE
eukprot:CAMPEP_0198156150 /NCGR_PEP_ID=MMETSP1443-20131203/69508_1 /TAXON_ID=186043 /ORGANISM="Entomoneis sp., Strain CCMP2396" /LENGTH=230 /DNA_ID=CAMNT_0043822933 /DNA_START=172 /DNA_END=861 /DNA_ORIENTATION=-